MCELPVFHNSTQSQVGVVPCPPWPDKRFSFFMTKTSSIHCLLSDPPNTTQFEHLSLGNCSEEVLQGKAPFEDIGKCLALKQVLSLFTGLETK